MLGSIPRQGNETRGLSTGVYYNRLRKPKEGKSSYQTEVYMTTSFIKVPFSWDRDSQQLPINHDVGINQVCG